MKIFNKNRVPLSELDNFISLTWHEIFFGCGKFELVVMNPINDIGYVYNTDLDQLGIVQDIMKESNKVVYKGRLLKFELNNKVISERINFKNKSADQIAKSLVSKFFPTILIENTEILSDVIPQTQVFGENVLEFTDELLQNSNLSGKIDYNFIDDVYTYKVDKIEDNTSIKFPLSISNGNIAKTKYSLNKSEFKNFAFIMGKKENDVEIITTVDLRKSTSETPIEIFVDKKSLSDKDLTDLEFIETLKQSGLEELKKYNQEEIIEFTPIEKDLKLGEKRLYNDNEIITEQIVTEIITTYENGVVEKTVEFGKINVKEKMNGK